MASVFKRPESILVVVYSHDGKVLLLKRADHAEFWQSVTGSMGWEEKDPRITAVRELREETGIEAQPQALKDLHLVQRFSILPEWRARFAPDITENTEYAFALELDQPMQLKVHPEHTEFGWFMFPDAIARATSWTNRAAIERVMNLRSPV